MKNRPCFFTLLLAKMALGIGDMYEANVNLDNQRFESDVLWSTEKVDLADCAVHCSSRLDCLSVQYSRTTRTCTLFGTVYLTSDTGVNETGWRYYQKTGGPCPARHTFTGIDGLCFLDGGERPRVDGLNYCTNMGSRLILVKSAKIENFLEAILERISTSYSHAKSAYIQGGWNSTHWVDDEGEVLQYTKWHSGVTLPMGSKSFTIKIKRFSSGYYWRDASSGDSYIRNVFCGLILK